MPAAGFWRRAAAWSLDAVPASLLALVACAPSLQAALATCRGRWAALADVLARHLADALVQSGTMPGVAVLPAVVRGALREPDVVAAADALESAVLAATLPPLLVFVAAFLAWSVGFERSRRQATPGKQALGLRVVARDGGAPGTPRLLLRFFAGALSWLTLNLGHLMAALPGHAALHDHVSGTRVVLADGAATPLPRWAVAWLVVLGLGGLFVAAWLGAAAGTALQAALERALWG